MLQCLLHTSQNYCSCSIAVSSLTTTTPFLSGVLPWMVGHLICLLVHPFTVFGLHRTACFLFDHCYLIITVSERGIAKVRCYPRFVSFHKIDVDIVLFLADISKIFCCSSVVRFTVANVARFDVDGCLLRYCGYSVFGVVVLVGLSGQNPAHRVSSQLWIAMEKL